jgi:hypothetical protein
MNDVPHPTRYFESRAWPASVVVRVSLVVVKIETVSVDVLDGELP